MFRLVQENAGYALVFTTAAALAFGVYYKSGQDYQSALTRYQNESSAQAEIAAKKVDTALNQIYQNLRTISFLPSVRNIDRHGTNLDENARQSIQQIYNNLASNVAMSEVYVVPIDLDPTKTDPVTNQTEVPILMFDALNFDPNKPQAEEAPRDPALPEEAEADEYAQFHELGKWLKSNYPNNSGLDALQTPMVAGSPVITCDNSDYDQSRIDEDRTGVMFNVPFFAPTGEIKGTIAGVVRNNALKALLPETDYTLVNTGYNIAFHAKTEGQQNASAEWVKQGKVDPNLIFSKVIDLNVNDPQGKWQIWVGFENEHFLESADATSVKYFRIGGYGLVAFLTLIGCTIVRRQKRYQVLQRLSTQFEGSVKDVVAQLVAATGQVQASVEHVTEIAEDTKKRSQAVANVSAGAAQSSAQIAAAAEELSASIREVSNNTQSARITVEEASRKAETAKHSIEQLSEKSNKVGEIVEVITDIANHINLLALNASIEAARAGDAGAGFAVVASEVKNLANQVGRAAEEITGQIKDMQSATHTSVGAVQGVMESILKVNQGSSTVAAAVAQQTTATNDIVQNISITATGAQEISDNIGLVQSGADKTSSTSLEVLDSARALAHQATILKNQVDTFLHGIRTA